MKIHLCFAPQNDAKPVCWRTFWANRVQKWPLFENSSDNGLVLITHWIIFVIFSKNSLNYVEILSRLSSGDFCFLKERNWISENPLFTSLLQSTFQYGHNPYWLSNLSKIMFYMTHHLWIMTFSITNIDQCYELTPHSLHAEQSVWRHLVEL